MTAEAAVVRAVSRTLDRHTGPDGQRVLHFNLHGSNGQTGLCDRLAGYRGRTLWLEVKRARGGRVSAKQEWMAQRAAACGWIALVVTDAAQVREILDQIDEEERMTDLEMCDERRKEAS